MNIDALLAQRLKHLSSDSGMVTHSHPDDRYLGNVLIAGDIQICPLFFHPLQDTNSGLTIQPGDLLHGDANGLLTIPPQIAESLARQARAVRDEEDEFFRYIAGDEFSVEGLKARFSPP